ncbi:MAG: ABC transporter substrate-binding protein, partial [Saprospiraceae bacterium]
MNRQNNSLLLVIALLYIFSFSACKSDPNVAKEETKEKIETKIVRSRLRAEPNKINPILTTKSQDLQVCDQVFLTLLNFNPETYELSPVLAKSRPEKKLLTEGPYKGGVAYTYEILDEAVWDNGTPVLASDYLFSIKALFNPLMVEANAYQGVLKSIQEIQIDTENPKRFTVYLDQVFRSEYTSGFYVYPEYAYDPDGLMKSFDLKELKDESKIKNLKENKAIKEFAEFFSKQGTPGTIIESCGAYKVVEWETGQRLILEKKKDWWGNQVADKNLLLRNYPEEIIFKAIPDDMATVTAMKDGQIDVASRINASMFLDFKKSEAGKKFNFLTPEFPFFSFMGLNTKKPHLSDKRVRRAIAHLTDVDEIIETVQKGMALRYAVPFPSNADYTDRSLKPIPFDIEKAKALLTEAGWEESEADGIRDKV